MSSSQTMTAPALGHHPPPNSGPDSMPFYDHRDVSSPLSDSAIRAMDNSASNDAGSPSPGFAPPNGLPSLASPFASPSGDIGGGGGAMGIIKTEPDDETAGTTDNNQTSFRRQSAASALLAQLLGNQSADQTSTASAEQQHQQQSASVSTSQPEPLTPNASQGNLNFSRPSNDGGDNNYTNMDQGHDPLSTGDLLSAPTEQTSGHYPISASGQLPGDMGQQNGENVNGEDQKPFITNTDDANANLFLQQPSKASDLSDPLAMSKSNLDQSDYLTGGPFDMTADQKTPFGEIDHNEMLTAAYLSEGADLSALGYSGDLLQQEGAGSVAGSEPRIQAFAKLEFDDGHFYCNTYSFILGRDVRAARAAHQREFQARQVVRSSGAKSSSGGNASHTPIRAADRKSVV